MFLVCSGAGWWYKFRSRGFRSEGSRRRLLNAGAGGGGGGGFDLNAFTGYLNRWQRVNNRSLVNNVGGQPNVNVLAAPAPGALQMTAAGGGPQQPHVAPAAGNNVHQPTYRHSANPGIFHFGGFHHGPTRIHPFNPAYDLGLTPDPRYASPDDEDPGPGIQLNIPSGIDITKYPRFDSGGIQRSYPQAHMPPPPYDENWAPKDKQIHQQSLSNSFQAAGSKEQPRGYGFVENDFTVGNTNSRRRSSVPAPIHSAPALPPGAIVAADEDDVEDEDSEDYRPSGGQPPLPPPPPPVSVGPGLAAGDAVGGSGTNLVGDTAGRPRSHTAPLRLSSQRITLPPIDRRY